MYTNNLSQRCKKLHDITTEGPSLLLTCCWILSADSIPAEHLILKVSRLTLVSRQSIIHIYSLYLFYVYIIWSFLSIMTIIFCSILLAHISLLTSIMERLFHSILLTISLTSFIIQFQLFIMLLYCLMGNTAKRMNNSKHRRIKTLHLKMPQTSN